MHEDFRIFAKCQEQVSPGIFQALSRKFLDVFRSCCRRLVDSLSPHSASVLFLSQTTSPEPVDTYIRGSDALHDHPATATIRQVWLHQVWLRPRPLLSKSESGGQTRSVPGWVLGERYSEIVIFLGNLLVIDEIF